MTKIPEGFERVPDPAAMDEMRGVVREMVGIAFAQIARHGNDAHAAHQALLNGFAMQEKTIIESAGRPLTQVETMKLSIVNIANTIIVRALDGNPMFGEPFQLQLKAQLESAVSKMWGIGKREAPTNG